MRDDWQPPPGNLNFRRMTQSLTDQMAWNFEDNGTDIVLREKVLAILECAGIESIPP
jgi:hypothetical protein